MSERKRVIGDMRNPVVRNCVECGKEFTTYRAKKIICSPECKKQRVERRTKTWYQENRDYALEMAKISYANKPGKARCKICGKMIKQEMLVDHKSRAQMHDKCVFDDAINTLRSGNELTGTQMQRLRARGFSVRELKKEVNEVNEMFSTTRQFS